MHTALATAHRIALGLGCTLGLSLPIGAAALPATDLVCTGCVQSTDLGNGAVTETKLGEGSVTGSKIKAASVYKSNLAADSVDGSKIKNGTVYRVDLAKDSVDSSKIADGSVAEADLGAALRDRLAALETRIAALSGGGGAPYGNATFKGTRRCLTLAAAERGENNGTGGGYAAVDFDSGAQNLTADGNGSGTYTGIWTNFERGWAVHWYRAGGFCYLGVGEDVEKDEPSDPGAFAYAVSA